MPKIAQNLSMVVKKKFVREREREGEGEGEEREGERERDRVTARPVSWLRSSHPLLHHKHSNR